MCSQPVLYISRFTQKKFTVGELMCKKSVNGSKFVSLTMSHQSETTYMGHASEITWILSWCSAFKTMSRDPGVDKENVQLSPSSALSSGGRTRHGSASQVQKQRSAGSFKRPSIKKIVWWAGERHPARTPNRLHVLCTPPSAGQASCCTPLFPLFAHACCFARRKCFCVAHRGGTLPRKRTSGPGASSGSPLNLEAHISTPFYTCTVGRHMWNLVVRQLREWGPRMLECQRDRPNEQP